MFSPLGKYTFLKNYTKKPARVNQAGITLSFLATGWFCPVT